MNKVSRTVAPLAVLVLFAAGLPLSASAAADPAGQVLAVRRGAVVIRQEQNLAAKPEMPLLLEDSVATAEQSRAKLFFRDDSILNLGEKSRVQVKEYLYSPEKQRSKSIYQLLDGSLKVVVGRSDLEIHSRTAVAAARGTSFILWAEEGDSVRSCLMVLDGSVALRSVDPKIEGEILVDAGNMNCVPFNEPPGRTAAIDQDLLKKMTADTLVVTGADWERLRGQPPVFAPRGQGAGGAPGGAAGEDNPQGGGSGGDPGGSPRRFQGGSVLGFGPGGAPDAAQPPVPQQPQQVVQPPAPPPPPRPPAPPPAPPPPPPPAPPAEEQQR